MIRNYQSIYKLMLIGFIMIVLVSTADKTLSGVDFVKTAFAATPVTVTFDFDTATPVLPSSSNTAFNQTVNDVTASFSSPSDPAAFSIQSADTTLFKLSQFSGNYLYDNKPSRDSLTIKFSQALTSISLKFATFEYHGAPGVEATNVTLTAYVDSTATTPVGTAKARGTWPSGDTWPQGVLSFNSENQPFNVVSISVPNQGVNAAIDFLMDTFTVTTSAIDIPEFPPTLILPLMIAGVTLASLIAKKKMVKTVSA